MYLWRFQQFKEGIPFIKNTPLNLMMEFHREFYADRNSGWDSYTITIYSVVQHFQITLQGPTGSRSKRSATPSRQFRSKYCCLFLYWFLSFGTVSSTERNVKYGEEVTIFTCFKEFHCNDSKPQGNPFLLRETDR